MAHGFLEITHYGGATEENAGLYFLSERYKAFGTDKFEALKKRQKDNRQDRGWAVYHKKAKSKRSKIIKLRPRIRLPKKKLSNVNDTG